MQMIEKKEEKFAKNILEHFFFGSFCVSLYGKLDFIFFFGNFVYFQKTKYEYHSGKFVNFECNKSNCFFLMAMTRFRRTLHKSKMSELYSILLIFFFFEVINYVYFICYLSASKSDTLNYILDDSNHNLYKLSKARTIKTNIDFVPPSSTNSAHYVQQI